MSVEKEPEGKYLDAGGLKLHYHEFGAGFPVICIHGAGPGASGWSNFKGNVKRSRNITAPFFSTCLNLANQISR